MNNTEIIREKYLEAIKGIQADWFLNSGPNLYNYVIKLPFQFQVAYLIVNLDNQIFNGGFHQYFVNGYGQFAKETIIALIEIGAIKKAQLLKEALELVNKKNDSDSIFREKLQRKDIAELFVKDDLFIPLAKLDSKYEAIEDEDIELLLSKYLSSFS